jgi:hypothetical protein
VPKVTPIQESFAAGEISPKLLGRRTIDGYKSGVAEMSNMIPDSRGPGEGRNGFRFSQSVVGDDVRLAILTVGSTSGILLIFTDLLLTATGLLGSEPSQNFVTNGDFLAAGVGWNDITVGGGANVVFSIGSARLNSGNAGRAYIAQQITILNVGINTVIVETDGVTPYRIKVGDSQDSDEYLNLLTSQARVEVEVDIQNLNPHITITRNSIDGGTNVIVVGQVIVAQDVSELTFVTPYPEGALRDLSFVEAPDGRIIYILHPDYPPQQIEGDGSGNITFGPVIFTSPPADWTGDSWPGAGATYEGRLWLGGTPTSPQTFWGSKSGALTDFTLGQNADDALEFTISRFGAIVWMMGTKNLLIGTVNGEHVVSSEAGVITPTDVQIDQQSAYGSKHVQPVQVGDQVFYVSLDGTKVRALQYEWSADNWLSKDLTFFSEHITASGIREMSWAPNPKNLLLCTLEDGAMAWLSYERGENVWGWSHAHTVGEVKDTTVGTVNGTSFAVAGIQRVEGEIYIETLVPFSNVFMDSWIDQENETPFTVVTGLDHLEGELVQVVADGAVSPAQVVTGGQITLPTEAIIAQVGLQYIPKLVSLPLESGSPTGSSLAYLKRYNRLIVGLLDSALPLINGVRAPDRSPSTPMNTVEPNRTGQVSAYQLGWSEGAIVTIEQDLPLPITVLYIGGELPQDVL